MELINFICGLIGVILTILTFFGIQFSKRYMFKKEQVYGDQAIKRYEHTKKTVHTGITFEPTKYQGGDNKRTPQLEIASFRYDKETMPPEWKGLTKRISFYNDAGQGGISEHTWIVK